MTSASPILVKTPPRQRVPNGVAAKRLRVAMPPELLAEVEKMAAQQLRTASAMATTLIAERLAELRSQSPADAQQPHAVAIEG